MSVDRPLPQLTADQVDYLVSCKLQLTVERPSIVSFSYRDVKKIDLAAFRADLAQSKLLQCSDDLDANTYAELMNDELRQLMDRHAPIKHKVKPIHPSNMSVHHYECVALCFVNILQRARS